MKIFGIPVTVQPFFLLMVAFLGYRSDEPFEFLIAWVIVVFISILIHEFGHAFAVRAFGMSPQIEISGFGGVTSWRDEKNVSPPKHIAISLAGPFAGFLFCGVVILVGKILPDLFSD